MAIQINAGWPLNYAGPGQTKVGSLLGSVQWNEYDYDPIRGVIYRYEIEAARSQNAYSIWQDLVVAGVACKLRFAQGKAILTADDSTQTYALDSWSLGSNDEQLSVFLNPIILADLDANVTGGSAAAIPVLQQALQSNEDAFSAFQFNLDTFAFEGIFENYGEGNEATLKMYSQIQQGVTDFRNAQTGEGYVLRHKTNFPNTTQDNVADFNVGYIYTTAQLLSEIGSNTLWNNPCPQYLQYKIAHFVPPPFDPTRTIGFFKDRSNVESAANNRLDVIQEYTYGQWSLSLYNPIPS